VRDGEQDSSLARRGCRGERERTRRRGGGASERTRQGRVRVRV